MASEFITLFRCHRVFYFMKCEYCSAEHNGSYGSGRFCSKECARGFSTQSKRKDINKKVSKTLSGKDTMPEGTRNTSGLKKGRYSDRDKSVTKFKCKYCGKEVTVSRKSGKYCSKSCMVKDFFRLGKFTGGLTRGGGQKHYKKGYYDGTYFDSAWELAYWLYCKSNGIKIERNTKRFTYYCEGKVKGYYPDFIVAGTGYVEIKGMMDEVAKAKISQFPESLKVITKTEMIPILDYVISKYGKEYFSLLKSK